MAPLPLLGPRSDGFNAVLGGILRGSGRQDIGAKVNALGLLISIPAAYCLAFGPPDALVQAAAMAVDSAAMALHAMARALSGASISGAAAAAGLALLAAATSAPPAHAATVCLVAAVALSAADAPACWASQALTAGVHQPEGAARSASAALFSAIGRVLPEEAASRLWLGVVAAAATQSTALLAIISGWDWDEQAKAVSSRQ